MMITQNLVTYDQQSLPIRLSNYFFEEEKIINFITDFGSAKISTHLSSYNTDWDKIKDELIIEYDTLWQDLAKS